MKLFIFLAAGALAKKSVNHKVYGQLDKGNRKYLQLELFSSYICGISGQNGDQS